MRLFFATSTVLAVAASSLSGCAAFDGGGSDGIQVATAFYPLQYVTERVAGDHAEVTNLTAPGQEPHDLELTVKDTGLVAEADLVVYEKGLQPSVDDAVEQNATGSTVDVTDVVDLRAAPDSDPGGEESSLDYDPHFWLDPVLLAQVGDAVADRLADVDPDHADDYAANAAALRDDLEALDRDFTAGLRDCARDTIVVSHDAFEYLSKYGLHVAAIAGLSPDAEPTPADIGRLQDLIDQEGITTVFGEALVSPELSQTLARDMGITDAVLDPVEGLTPDTADEDYLSLMHRNLDALRKADGCR
ncbi:MAG TPA: metal ABC transporter substrate-binding protein [Nocardioides sp.]|nr:metal ABC transporter substrate-binding protein [Nocardioides sp.]